MAPPRPGFYTPPPSAPFDPGTHAPPPQSSAENAILQGTVVVDAGPFTDIAVLSQFEQALGRLPGAQDVYVRGFEGQRAVIDVQLAGPIAFGTELRRVSGLAFGIRHAGPGSIAIDLAAHG
jgi:hypothetical protein